MVLQPHLEKGLLGLDVQTISNRCCHQEDEYFRGNFPIRGSFPIRGNFSIRGFSVRFLQYPFHVLYMDISRIGKLPRIGKLLWIQSPGDLYQNTRHCFFPRRRGGGMHRERDKQRVMLTLMAVIFEKNSKRLLGCTLGMNEETIIA